MSLWRHQPPANTRGGVEPPTPSQRLIGLAIVAGVLIVVTIVTRSADAIAIAAPVLLLLLGWVSTGSTDRDGGPRVN